MPEPKMKTMVVVSADVLENTTVVEILRLLTYFENAKDDEGKLVPPTEAVEFFRRRGSISIWAEITTTMTPLGPTLRLRNKPADIELTIPWSEVRYIVRVPDEGNQLAGVGFRPSV